MNDDVDDPKATKCREMREAAEIAGTNREKARQKRRAEFAVKEFEARLAEYEDAGLDPPNPSDGIIVSLPMMLLCGWTIKTIGKQRMLIEPQKKKAPAPSQEPAGEDIPF